MLNLRVSFVACAGWIAFFTVHAVNLRCEKSQPVINKEKWHVSPLSFRATNISAMEDTLWVCGVDETLAMSKDHGVTWAVEHSKQDGELLLNVSFINEKIGHAAGSGGLVLSTTDGGQRWASHGRGDTVQQFSFATLNDGIAEVGGTVSLTSDGGEHWQRVNVPQLDSTIQPPYVIESVAALSETTFAFELHKDNVEEVIYATQDTGKTWTPVHLTNIIARTIIPHEGEFWDFGIEYLGREHNPGGGYGVAAALHSKDGVHWDHGVRATNEFDGCNAQSCFLRYGVLEDVYSAQEKIWSLPEDSNLSRNWAMVGDVVCTVDHDLKCGQAIPSPVPQPMPDTGAISISVEHQEPLMDGCLDCQFGQIPKPAVLRGKAGMIRGITVSLEVKRNGTVDNVRVQGLPVKELEGEIKSRISEWLVSPDHRDGATVSQHKSFQVDLLCFPDPPWAHAEAFCSVKSAGAFQKLH